MNLVKRSKTCGSGLLNEPACLMTIAQIAFNGQTPYEAKFMSVPKLSIYGLIEYLGAFLLQVQCFKYVLYMFSGLLSLISFLVTG